MNAMSTVGSVNRPRTKQLDKSDAKGQLGLLLRDYLKKHPDAEERISSHMGITPRAVRKWCEGESGPSISDLDKLAKFIGYEDWGKLASAAVRFAKR